MSAHEDWVTSRTKAWLDEEYREFIDARIAYARRQNAEAGNDPADSFDDDAEWLGDELNDMAVEKLADGQTGITRDFVLDCLSETDWLELAGDYLRGAQ